jgi:hypothetical protein
VVPGVLVPDGPVELAGQPAAGQPAAGQPAAGQQGVTRLRELVRDGLLALTGPGADPAAVADTLRSATAAPTRALALAAVDPTGALAAALGAGPRECWLIRPDGHVAAVLPGPDPAGLRAAVARCLAADPTGPAPSPPRPT